MEFPHLFTKPKQQRVRNPKQRTSQCGKDGKLIIRPLDRIQDGPYGLHFFPLME